MNESFGEFTISSYIKSGTFADIYIAKDKSDNRFAVKLYYYLRAKKTITFGNNFSKNPETCLNLIENEVKVLKQCSHPNIISVVSFHDFITSEDERALAIVLPLCLGEISNFDYETGCFHWNYIYFDPMRLMNIMASYGSQTPANQLINEHVLSDTNENILIFDSTNLSRSTTEDPLIILKDYINSSKEIFKNFYGIIDALYYLHSKGIAHRDIKPSNILILKDKFVLSDFQSTDTFDETNVQGLVSRTKGTLSFWPPEVFNTGFEDEEFDFEKEFEIINLDGDNNDKNINLNSLPTFFSAYLHDQWSLSIVLYILVFHQHPFLSPTESLVMKNIISCEAPFNFHNIYDASFKIIENDDSLSDEIKQEAVELLSYLNFFVPLLNKLLKKQTSQRLSLESFREEYKNYIDSL